MGMSIIKDDGDYEGYQEFRKMSGIKSLSFPHINLSYPHISLKYLYSIFTLPVYLILAKVRVILKNRRGDGVKYVIVALNFLDRYPSKSNKIPINPPISS